MCKRSVRFPSHYANVQPQDDPAYTSAPFVKEESHTYVSPSVRPAHACEDGQADDEQELQEILDACELDIFEPEVAKVFENAIERLFYSDSFRIGNATLPQSRVRSRLRLLDWMILDGAREKLQSNLGRQVKNSTAYTMAAECFAIFRMAPSVCATILTSMRIRIFWWATL